MKMSTDPRWTEKGRCEEGALGRIAPGVFDLNIMGMLKCQSQREWRKFDHRQDSIHVPDEGRRDFTNVTHLEEGGKVTIGFLNPRRRSESQIPQFVGHAPH